MADQRYRVTQRLEAGGMAEVFIGEALSVQGFKKRVAIKRVLPHLAQNKNFIGMFLDEARLGAKLDHANIVSVFDIGAADNTYFIVMEYVDGANLKKVIETVRRRERTFPMKEAIYLCMEACRGLSYAHELTEDDETPLGLVHRDISPPNILISKRGEVKVTDFGLAKATTQLEKTDPGVVKGKFSYLSPEAARAEEVDARADIFAMGIVLWEMLAGRRLFLGETDYQTIKLVQEAKVPSLSELNPEVNAEFEQIVNRSLTSDPRDRYQTAREFGDALAGYLFGHQMKVTSYDIAALVKRAAAEGAQRPKSQEQQSIIDKLIQEEMVRFTSLDDMSSPFSAEPGSPTP
ncbi:MAG: serine/threonine protein kinase, partial [Myxococcales bacterium]|nr:serine/threonine protein kinase [Myxococcales bacterium]